MQEHVQSDEINTIVTANNNHINEQLAFYNNLLRDSKYGTLEVDGKTIELTSSNSAKYLSARDRETRKQTYFMITKMFHKQQVDFSNILDAIFTDRIKNAELENYSSVLEKIVFEENIDPKIIETLIKAVNNNLGLMQAYLKIKADLLDIKDPHLYDLNVPIDHNLKIKYTMEEAIEIIKKALNPLGKKYLEVVDQLIDGHIDAEPNDKKHQSLTFSWNTYSFMNFRGSYLDLKNMIHEIGHIVNYYLSKEKLPFLYEDSTIFVGETASIVNEILLNRYLCDHATTEEERIFYLSKEIENYMTSVFKQTMYTEYETDLYQTKKTQKLTPELLSKKYGTLLKKYYGTDITYDEQSNVEWTRLGHLYRWSYYPYKYATGLLIASVVVNNLLDEQTISLDQYLDFLSSGSCLYSLDTLKLLDIDLTNPHIIENGFHVMEKDIYQLNKTLTKKKRYPAKTE